MKTRINLEAVHGHLCNALELERSSGRIYEAALSVAPTSAAYARWSAALEQSHRTEIALESILADLGLDPDRDSPQRRSIRCVGESLLESMRRAVDPAQRRSLARECVRLADARDRSNWELLGQLLSIGADRSSRPTHAVRRRATTRDDVRATEWYRRAAGARCESQAARSRDGDGAHG